MSFEFIVEPEQKIKKLDDVASEDLAKRIAADFDTYDEGRKSNLDKANALMEEIFFLNKKSKDKKWKSNAKLNKPYMFYQTLKAFVWKNIYSNINSMFDVSGENLETDNNSNKQKTALCDVFDKMTVQQTLDKVIDLGLIYGEIITFEAWKKKYEQFRRPIEYFVQNYQNEPEKLPLVMEALNAGKNFYIDERKIYDNPYVYEVNPANLVFDVTQKDNWDACPKIYKSYKAADDIINNKYYKISAEAKEAIKNMASELSRSNLNSQSAKDLQNEIVNGDTVEVLEHWGNLKLKDGTVLKNWHAVVVGRRYLVQFEKNDRIINPFTYGAFIVDPKTKRGISPLYAILELSELYENYYNRTANMQALAENPPVFAPEGFFENDENEVAPGKIIEFGDNLSPNEIMPVQFNTQIFNQNIAFLDDMMAEVSGIFPNMAGQEEAGNKTATEISTKAQGQLTRLSMILDTINQYLIIPMVENVAKLLADFKFGNEEIYVNKDNKQETVVITDEVRQGQYKYTYSDRTMTADRIQKADRIAQIMLQYKEAGVPIDVNEFSLWYLEQQGLENPERFIIQGIQLPQEVQQEAIKLPEVQALLAGYQQRQQEEQSGKQPEIKGEIAPPTME